MKFRLLHNFKTVYFIFIIINFFYLNLKTESNSANQDITIQRSFNSNSSCSCSNNCQTISKLPSTIKTSGVFCLNCDLFASSCDKPLITINASEVVLDLNGFALSSGSTAIQINSNLSNIIIKNGTITNMTGPGILVLDGTENIQLLDLKVINTNQCAGTASIYFQGTNTNSTINNRIQNVEVSDGNNFGILLEFAEQTKVKNTSVQSIVSINNAPITAGIRDFSGSYNLFENCNVSHITGFNVSAKVIGFDIESQASKVRFCKASNVVAMNATNTQAIGFFLCILTGTHCTSAEHCISNNNSSTSGESYGFLSQSTAASVIKNCSACNNAGFGNNTGPGMFGGNGFSFQLNTASSMFGCISQNNSHNGYLINGTNSSAVGESKALANGLVGFNLADANPSVIFFSNFAASNGLNPSSTNYVNIPPNLVVPLGTQCSCSPVFPTCLLTNCNLMGVNITA
jgi:hypothetical protein